MKGLLCSLLAMACIYIGSVNIAPGRDIEVFVVGSKTLDLSVVSPSSAGKN